MHSLMCIKEMVTVDVYAHGAEWGSHMQTPPVMPCDGKNISIRQGFITRVITIPM